MDIVYNNGGPRSHHERKVVEQGWKWVNTNTINPTGSNEAVTVIDGRPDRLAEHSHHGESTHSVIAGDLRIQRSQQPHVVYTISSDAGAPKQDRVPPKLLYSATSRFGCTFVEGHKCLSPESAERFISRGTLKVVDKRARRSFPNDNRLGMWLRQVKFNPNGKAHPNFAMGERPILDAKHVYPPIPDDVYSDLSEWFENEWLGPKWLRRLRQVVWVLLIFTIFMWCVKMVRN
ncbi:hypothetical protein CHU98_g8337 [Xylaria longipes]|nr:hypothetical protein CHU98_g8337 [Xylaria longipes]